MLKYFVQSTMRKGQWDTSVLSIKTTVLPHTPKGKRFTLNRRHVSFLQQMDLVFIVHVFERMHVIISPIFYDNSHYRIMQ